jgi:opacity protein-like surface antigen
MRFAVRFIGLTAIALFLMSALFADDTAKPKATAKTDEPAAAVTAPIMSTEALNSGEAPPVEAATVPQSQTGANTQPVSALHSWGESENYTPKIEWFLGYSFWRAMPTALSNRMGYLHGGSTSVAYNFNRYVGVVADFPGFANSRLTLLSPTVSQTTDANGSAYTYAFGPRFSYRRNERFTLYFQALFGGAHASSVTISGCTAAPTCTPLGTDNTFVTMLGTGFDIKLSRHIALRLFEGDFLLTHFKNPLSTDGQARGWQDNARFSTGIVFHLGGSR